MLVNKCNCLFVGVIEVYFDVNDYKVPLKMSKYAYVCQLTLLNIDTYSNILIERSNNTNEMYSRVDENLIYVVDITFGINESILSGNEQQKVYLLVADTLGVNRSTARGIVARYIRTLGIAERTRGVRNHVRVDDEMRDCLNDIVNEN